jgi:hypothetical protein
MIATGFLDLEFGAAWDADMYCTSPSAAWPRAAPLKDSHVNALIINTTTGRIDTPLEATPEA